jgi:hypothetical protein
VSSCTFCWTMAQLPRSILSYTHSGSQLLLVTWRDGGPQRGGASASPAFVIPPELLE